MTSPSDRELMQMALDALEEYKNVVTSGTDPKKWDEVVDGGKPARNAIKALRERLSQPETEPVARVDGDNDRLWVDIILGSNLEVGQPLYAASQKREWVELTDDEVFRLSERIECCRYSIVAAEAKLKEKNA